MEDDVALDEVKPLDPKNLPEGFADPTLPKGTFSHSQYTSFLFCAKAYEFRYVHGLSGNRSGATARGSAVHKGIEVALKAKIAKQPIPPINELIQVVSDAFDQEAEKVEVWEPDTTAGSVKDIAIDVYRSFHVNAIARLNPVAVEKGFAVKFGSLPMIGYIDLIDEVPALDTSGMDPEVAASVPRNKVIVDMKTTRAAWSGDKVHKNTQLTLYTAVEQTPHARIDQLVLLKRAPAYKQTATTRTSQDIEVFQEHLEETAAMVRAGIFPMTTIDSWCCNPERCAYWDKCRGRKR